MELAGSRVKATKARWSCLHSCELFTQPIFRQTKSKARSPLSGSLLYFSCDDIHPERVELASPVELTSPLIEVVVAHWSCVNALEVFSQSILPWFQI